jgi:hypothetical protein
VKIYISGLFWTTCNGKIDSHIYRVPKKKQGLWNYAYFALKNGTFTIKITVSNTNMIRSILLAIIQAFTAPWEIKFEEMVVILIFYQKMDKHDNINRVFVKFILNHDLPMFNILS